MDGYPPLKIFNKILGSLFAWVPGIVYVAGKNYVFDFLLLVDTRNVPTLSLRSNHAFGLGYFNSSDYRLDCSVGVCDSF